MKASLTNSMRASVLVLGPLLAWVLVRYRFPGRKLVDALVDLPFALPTAVAAAAAIFCGASSINRVSAGESPVSSKTC